MAYLTAFSYVLFLRAAKRCVLPQNFVLPRSSVKRSLQLMDQRDTPDCPGEVKLGELLKAVDRFHRTFGEKIGQKDWDLELMEERHRETRLGKLERRC
eukprot:g3539.t1